MAGVGQDQSYPSEGLWPAGRPPLVVSLGDIVLDVLVSTERPLVRASDVRGTVEFSPGGSGANFAVWMARLGARVTMAGALGSDFIGDYLLSDLVGEGVDVSGVARLPGRSPSVFVHIGYDGERTMVTDRRVTLRLSPEHIPLDVFSGVRHLHLTAYSFFDELPRATALYAVEVARSQKATISLDLSSSALIESSGAAELARTIGRVYPDVLFGNADELQALFGRTDREGALDLAERLTRIVVVKLGDAGCLVRRAGCVTEIPTTAVRPVDTTGAGDAFDAAWIQAWLRGCSPEVASVEANQLAGQVVGVVGSRGRLP